MSDAFRTEHDSMGDVQIPAAALFGAQTQRAVENFPISRLRFGRSFIRALGLIKSAAAQVNGRLGLLPAEIAKAIAKASDEIAKGRHDAEFVVDVFQTGSGTSTNMNANEIIATLAGRITDTKIHPNDQVNLGQSSNDVFPTAIHIAAAESIQRDLLRSMHQLQAAFEEKAEQFWDFLKIGRTHLQDAVPIRLGQEFKGYARQLELAQMRITQALEGIYELPLGGTAVGSGINAPPGFAAAVIVRLSEVTRLPFREASNHFEAQGSRDGVAFLSSALRNYALALTKIANDIRWMGSGPRAGLAELKLPELQPGSSIMPGKVNPVIAESVLMVCAKVIGNDAAIAWCCAAGNFELNVMMPVMAYSLIESIELLAAASKNFAEKCIVGLEADRERLAQQMERSLALATALTPEIGYDRAAFLAKHAAESGETIREIAKKESGLPEDRLTALLDLGNLV
jgi:fumarate hydratase class II